MILGKKVEVNAFGLYRRTQQAVKEHLEEVSHSAETCQNVLFSYKNPQSTKAAQAQTLALLPRLHSPSIVS